MDNLNDIKKVVDNKKKRHFLKWFVRFTFLIFVMMLVGGTYEATAESSDARSFPPPGRLVDIGGYRLHLNCTGMGDPTVVIESGWGDFSETWSWVQPEVAKTTRVCTYDRSGMGWSDVSSEPRTASEFAKELHMLLVNAKENGPFVLVGHSMGGYTMRVFAHDYPGDVVGLVLVDPQNLSNSNIAPTIPAPKPGKISLPSLLARFGVIRLLAYPLGAIQNLPSQDKKAYTALSVIPRSVQTFLDEGRGMSQGAEQARSVTTLKDLPLIVLSRGKDMDADSAASQARYLQLSTNSQQLTADRSGHRIMVEQPDAAIGAIVKMVDIVRQKVQL